MPDPVAVVLVVLVIGAVPLSKLGYDLARRAADRPAALPAPDADLAPVKRRFVDLRPRWERELDTLVREQVLPPVNRAKRRLAEVEELLDTPGLPYHVYVLLINERQELIPRLRRAIRAARKCGIAVAAPVGLREHLTVENHGLAQQAKLAERVAAAARERWQRPPAD